MKKHKSIRIFKNDFLESLSHVHPITPLVVWSPVVLFLFWRSILNYNLSVIEILTWFVVGIVAFTFSEYVIHRWAFHYPAKSKVGKMLVWLGHGLHHDDPQDPTRLVMPPVMAIVLMSILYVFYGLFIPARYMQIFMAFFIIGYLCYDYIHYATHHFKMTSKVGHYLRAYHLKHHYSHLPEKYGVSNPFWDYVFNTVEAPKTLSTDVTGKQA